MVSMIKLQYALKTAFISMVLVALPGCYATTRAIAGPNLTTADKIATAVALTPGATPIAQTVTTPSTRIALGPMTPSPINTPSPPPPIMSATAVPTTASTIVPSPPRQAVSGTTVATTVSATIPSLSPTQVVMWQRVVSAEATLRTVQFNTTIDYGGGGRSSVIGQVDFGAAEQPRRVQMVTTYQAQTGARMLELIAIGDQSWQREPTGLWIPTTQDGLWGQLQSFMPRLVTLTSTALSSDGSTLRWYDLQRDADMILRVDAFGIPLELRQQARGTKVLVTVTYSGWNAPVNIGSPKTP